MKKPVKVRANYQGRQNVWYRRNLLLRKQGSEKCHPSSNFRETSKDVASGAMNGNMNMGNTATGNSLSQWGMQAMTNAYQKTANAISKAIKKNSAKLKYGTFVYLVNGKEKKND